MPALDVLPSAAREALAHTQIPHDLPRPNMHDLESLRTSGKPWSYVQPSRRSLCAPTQI